MKRCGLKKNNGVTRIAILCDKCSFQAARLLKGVSFKAHQYDGPQACESCHWQEPEETGEING